MIELNLLPDVKQEFVRTERMKRVIISLMILASIAAATLVALLAFYVYVAQPIRQNLADDDIKKYNNELTSNGTLTRDLTIQNQLKVITQLHEDKISIKNLFNFFTVLNPEKPNNIKISSAILDSASGTISLEATAVSYNAVSIFQDTLKNAQLSYKDDDSKEQASAPLFTDIKVSDVTLAADSIGTIGVSFKQTLTYEPRAFAWTTQNRVISIPSVDTTPSAERVSIFSEAPAKKQGGQ